MHFLIRNQKSRITFRSNSTGGEPPSGVSSTQKGPFHSKKSSPGNIPTDENCSRKINNSTKKNERFFQKGPRGRKKGNWREDEDQLLLDWVEANGPQNWTECAKKIRGRCGKQCRERWVNALDPRIKRGNWEEQEHALIFEQMKTNWSSWTLISKKLPGRTENAIKNYFYSSVRRLRTSKLFQFLRILVFGEEVGYQRGETFAARPTFPPKIY